MSPETVPPPDPYRWLEEPGAHATRRWLERQRQMLEHHLPAGPGDCAWEALLDEVDRAADGRLAGPPVEAAGTVFRHRKRADGDVITAQRPDAAPAELLALRDFGSSTRISSWLPTPDADRLVVQLHHGGREHRGLTLIRTRGTGEPEQVTDAAPYPGIGFLDDWLLYTAGSRTTHTLLARHLPSGATHSVRLPVTAPARLVLRTGPGGALALRTRTRANATQWWVTRWHGEAEPDWSALPVGDGASAVELADDSLYVAAGGVERLDLADLARNGTSAEARSLVPAPAGAGSTGVRTLRVLSAAGGTRLAVLWRTGTTRRLEVRPVDDPGSVETALDWPARIQLGPAAQEACWLLADDPHHGPWPLRIAPGRPAAAPGEERAALRTTTARGEDGSDVPVTICDPAPGARGPAPALVTVYGGFGIPLEPTWDPLTATWLRAGGRVVWVHARGGGELGPHWAAAGRGRGKRMTVADLCAAAGHLLAEEETAPGRMAVVGASNGGLVVAAALTRRPDLFTAAVCAAPLTDLARYTTGGLGEQWLQEYGDPRDPAALADLLAYSPYHQVRAGSRYPAVLMISGGNDERVPPWHAWKLCAALQQATGADAPVLLDHHEGSGHHGRTRGEARELVLRTLRLLASRTGLEPPAAVGGRGPAAE